MNGAITVCYRWAMNFKLGEQVEKKRDNLHAGLLVLQKQIKIKRYFHLKVEKSNV